MNTIKTPVSAVFVTIVSLDQSLKEFNSKFHKHGKHSSCKLWTIQSGNHPFVGRGGRR